jgi:hypothetical protein
VHPAELAVEEVSEQLSESTEGLPLEDYKAVLLMLWQELEDRWQEACAGE